MLATLELGDALLREFALLEMGEAAQAGAGHRRKEVALPIDAVLDVAEAAAAAGQSGIDVEVVLPLAAAGIAPREAPCRRGGRATGPAAGTSSHHLPFPRSRRVEDGYSVKSRCSCREGCRAHGSSLGSAPTPSSTGRPSRRYGRWGPVSSPPDPANYIVFVSPGAAELLGWEPEALVAQRLTTIIPPELRQAHLAAFTRYQLTGEPHIMDKPVPAARSSTRWQHRRCRADNLPARPPRRTLFATTLRAI